MKTSRIADLAGCGATGGLGPRWMSWASATGSLSPAVVKMMGGMLRELRELDARETAYKTVINDVDPAGTLSRWATAQAIANRLRRFKSAAYRRIKADSRPCQGDIEEALVELCDGCCSAGKIWEKLRDMNLPEQR